MKLIIAYIQPYRLNDVKAELVRAEVLKMSITNALGCGQQGGYDGTWKGVHMEVNLHKKIRMEVAVNDNFVDATIQAIMRGASSNTIGDGKIFVVPLEKCYRIRNGDEDHDAIG